MLVKIALGGSMLFALYSLTIIVALKFFISYLVFLPIPVSKTQEDQVYSVRIDAVETLIREYRSKRGSYCALYFPGRHGGIPRYENEIFKPAVDQGISIFAISYPGYEGAVGTATFENVMAMTRAAIEYINVETSCDITKSVFIGRSLGAAIAFQNAVIFKPQGLVLDSVSLSLSHVIDAKIEDTILLWPARILPVASVIGFDIDMRSLLSDLKSIPVVIFQGEWDSFAKFERVQDVVKNYPNIELIKVYGATHANTHIASGQHYFEKLSGLLEQHNE